MKRGRFFIFYVIQKWTLRNIGQSRKYNMCLCQGPNEKFKICSIHTYELYLFVYFLNRKFFFPPFQINWLYFETSYPLGIFRVNYFILWKYAMRVEDYCPRKAHHHTGEFICTISIIIYQQYQIQSTPSQLSIAQWTD